MPVWIQKLSWYAISFLALAGGLFVAKLSRLLHFPALAMPLAATIAIILLGMKYKADLPVIRRQQHNWRRRYRLLALLGWAPPVLPALLTMHWRLLKSLLCWLQRKPYPWQAPAGHHFGYLKKVQYQTIVIIILLGLFVELPLHGLILSLVIEDLHLRARLETILFAIAAYTLLTLLADRYAVRATKHVLTGDALLLRIGDRFKASIPRNAIQHAFILREDKRLWLLQQKISVLDTINITPADTPNIVIELKPGATPVLQCLMLSRPAPRFLFIYVDEPGQLLDLLQAED